MLIDFKQQQIDGFLQLMHEVQQAPELYLNWHTVADFYQSEWLVRLPKAVNYVVLGLDDGAVYFDAKISLYQHCFYISVTENVNIRYVQLF